VMRGRAGACTLPIMSRLPLAGFVGRYSVAPVRRGQGAGTRYQGLIRPSEAISGSFWQAKLQVELLYGTAVSAAASISSALTRRSTPTVFLTR
jgi:hypothetical protein